MKIRLIDIDGKLPNLALMKLSTWHKSQGDEVYLNKCEHPDKVYISVLFTWNRYLASKLAAAFPHSIIDFGGTGWDVHKKLPTVVEACTPDYDLYTVADILPRIKGGIATKSSKEKKAAQLRGQNYVNTHELI